MNIDEFLTFTAAEFQLKRNELSISTEFRNLPFWSSLNALIFISAIHDESGVLLSSSDLSKSKTLGDLFTMIQSSK
jgi:acyl carrier protein